MATSDQTINRHRAALQASVEDVSACSLEGLDRAVALAVLLADRLGVLTASRTRAASEGATHGSNERGSNDVKAEVPADTDLVHKICRVTNIERDVADLIYDNQDGGLGYVISARKLASSKAEATRQLAQIIVVGRQAAGLEEWTPSSTIREVVSDYGKFDSANFASHLQRLEKDNAVLFRGKGSAREIKVTRAGFEVIAESLKDLAGA